MKRIDHRRRSAASGFTLLELLIVIGVIALLAGISFAVYGNIMATARKTATEATIAKIDGLLSQQVSAFYRQLDPRAPETRALAGYFRSTLNLTNDRETSMVLATKGSFLRAFPQNLYEAAGFDRDVGTADDIPLFVEWLTAHNPSVAGNPAISEADSSELLFLALTEGKVRGSTPVDRSAFTASELGDTDQDGWTELIDAWGRPLRFYRWPTRLINPFGLRANILTAAMDNSQTALTLNSTSAFGPPLTPPFRVVVGREIIEVNGVSGNDLTGLVRGAQSTDPATHAIGDRVKLAPFTEVATLLLGFVNSDVLAKDPDDKFGAVAELHPLALMSAGDVLANIGPLSSPPFAGNEFLDYELLFHTLDSYHAPLIVSAGADGELGLVEPGPISVTGVLPDPSDPRNPQNIWIPGNSPVLDETKWGTLAQPDSNTYPNILTNPGSSALADNVTNYNGSN